MRLLSVFLFLILLAGPAEGQSTGRAERLLEAGKYRQARVELLRLLDEDSREVAIHYLLGRTYDALGEFDYALRALQQADRLTRDGGWKRRIHLLRERIRTESRRQILHTGEEEAAATESPILARTRHGRLLEMQRNYAGAMREYLALQAQNPESRTGFFLAARLKLAQGQREAALENLRQVFRLAPEDTASVELLIRHGFSPGEIEKLGFAGSFDYDRIERYAAERLYRQGLKLRAANTKDTTRLLARAIELNPDHRQARRLLMEEYYQQGNLDGAFDEAGELLRLDEKDSRAREIRYLVLQRWGYRVEAVRELQEGLKQDTNAVALRLYLGLDLKNRRKKKQAAYRELVRVIELDPENRDAADALQEMGLRHNQLRKLGYRGILLPVDFHPLDKVFIPREKKAAVTAPPRPAPPKAASYEKRGRYARRHRREPAETDEVQLVAGRGEVQLGTGEIALQTPATAEVDLPVTLDELLALAALLPDSELRAEIRRQTVARIYEQLDEEGRWAYAAKLEFEIAHSCTEAVTLKQMRLKRTQEERSVAPLPVGTDTPVDSGGTAGAPPATGSRAPQTPLPGPTVVPPSPATGPSKRPPAPTATRPVAEIPPRTDPGQTPLPPQAETAPGSNQPAPAGSARRPWWKFWDRSGKPGTSPVGPGPVFPPIPTGSAGAGSTPVGLQKPPAPPPARPIMPVSPTRTTAPPQNRVRPSSPNAWWHWGTKEPELTNPRPLPPPSTPVPKPADPPGKTDTTPEAIPVAPEAAHPLEVR